jgi:RNA polymerase sigma-70 factor (ECF subfamily)
MIVQALSGDGKAWERFASHCQRVISAWCRSWGLSPEDRDDTVQESMLVVLVKVHDFRRTGRGSLRAWLKAVAWRCRCEASARARSFQRLQEIRQRFREATNEIEELEQEFDRLYELDRLERCLLAVRERVTSQTWAAFQKHAIERMPGLEWPRSWV